MSARAPGKGLPQGKREKPWRNASEWTSSAKPSSIAVGTSALHHRDPYSGWSQRVTYHLMAIEMRAERRRKAERKRLFQKLCSHHQGFSALWKVSYYLGFLTQPELSTQPVRDYSLFLFPCSFTCLWHDLESCHPAAAELQGIGLAEAYHLRGISHFPSTSLHQPVCWG